MIKNETLHIRVNESVRNNAEATLEILGISMSEAINMFLCQVNLVGGIPFDVKVPACERIIVHNEEELLAKLDESEKNIEQGETYSADEMYARLEAKYGL